MGPKHHFEISITYGDIFEDSHPSSSLAHCVSSDFKLGKGIAKEFLRKFDGLHELKEGDAQIGSVVAVREGRRFIYNLITKYKYNDLPTYENLRHALIAMKNHAVKHGVRKISMPKIGCGLDQLNWETVKNIVKSEFSGTDIQIFVFILIRPGKLFMQ